LIRHHKTPFATVERLIFRQTLGQRQGTHGVHKIESLAEN
jgi:hypothetical protein